ncbi:MAG TPA: dual specificity protein phosphatase family protein [Bryobacteraceae bacterium]|nr:dual specificity protein phosphatase family protein [Bryobacteraceae bacterium]
MVGTELYRVDGPWRGKLALAARPRGGEWLEDEIASWQRQGVDTVFSLLTGDEERELDLAGERDAVRSAGLKFLSFPIEDRKVPESETALREAVEQLDEELAAGKHVALHCRQGIGRTGLVAACLLLTRGIDAKTAVARLSKARGTDVPETPEQRRWIDHFAGSLAARR